MTKCWKPIVAISVFGVLLLIAIIVIAIMVIIHYKNEFFKNYKLSIVNFCENLKTQDNSAIVVRPKTPGIYEYEISRALLNTSLLVTQSNCRNIVPVVNPKTFTNQHILYGKTSNANFRHMFATIFTDFENQPINTNISKTGKMLIVFTGTFFMDEWMSDFSAKQVEASLLNNYKTGVSVHYGFYSIYLSIRDQIWDLYNNNIENISDIFITGHSLGGALSTICAFDFALLNPVHYSFAAPRSGSVTYANTFNQILPTSLRIYNTSDIIPNLPPPIFIKGINYEQTNQDIPFTVNLGSIGANHVTAYIEYLPKCLKNIAPCN